MNGEAEHGVGCLPRRVYVAVPAQPPRPITASHEEAGRTLTLPTWANGAIKPSTRSRLSASTIMYKGVLIVGHCLSLDGDALA